MKSRYQSFVRNSAVFLAGGFAAASVAVVSLHATIALLGVACVLAAAGLGNRRFVQPSA